MPGPETHFLINPFGMLFSEITALSLVKIDIEGRTVAPTPYRFNYAGFVIHSAIHAAREDAHFIIHLHTDDGVAVSSQKEGVLPLNQRSLNVLKRLAYHDYEGVATSLEERARIVAHLGDRSLLVLRNHGTLAVGGTAGEAWMGIYNLEKTCTAQIRALSAGRDNVLMVPEEVQRLAAARVGDMQRSGDSAQLAWQALLRRVRRESPGFDT